MKSLLTVSGVVFAHICVFLLLVNGCRGTSSDPNQWNSDTSLYSAGARESQPAPAIAEPEDELGPVAAEPVKTPAVAKPVKATPQPATGTQGQEVYLVKKGEYLSMIALRHGLTTKELADANGIALNSVLKIDQALKIPAPKQKTSAGKGEVSGEMYVVQKGDVLGTIAQKNKTTVAKIKAANNLKNDVIRVGQKLVIPSKNAAADAKKPANAEPVKASTPKEKSIPSEKKEEAPVASEPSTLDFGMPEGGFGSLENVQKNAETEAQPETPVEESADGPATGTTEE